MFFLNHILELRCRPIFIGQQAFDLKKDRLSITPRLTT